MIDKHKILIVDDEPLNVKLFAATLSSEGYEIITAYGGKQALQKVNEEFPDLILLDIMMPDMDGFEVTRKIKGHFKTKNIPIILITALDALDYKAIGLEAGADEFLNKPIKTIELKSRVRSLVKLNSYRNTFERQKQADTDESHSSEKKDLYNKTVISSVLLVTENENEANLIKMYLQGQPYQLITKKNTKEAIELLKQQQIDLILLDTMYEGFECFKAFGRLKEKEQTGNIQILVCSDLGYLEKNREQFEYWCDDFLLKPTNIHELRLRVKSLLKKKSYLDQLYTGGEGNVSSAITDRLSGLVNYSYFKYFLEHEIKRSQRDGRPVAIIMMELFGVNHKPNCLGHLAGEEMLKELGTIIKKNIRDIDLGARYKEKKFAIVLADTDVKGANVVSERLRDVIQNHLAKGPRDTFEKTAVQSGIVVYPHDADSLDLLIHRAEETLLKT